MQLSDEFIKEALKQQGKERRATTYKINRGEYPLDKNFVCPYCNYISKTNQQGSARIFSNTKNFFCFACNERREVKL